MTIRVTHLLRHTRGHWRLMHTRLTVDAHVDAFVEEAGHRSQWPRHRGSAWGYEDPLAAAAALPA
jgi:hypothetical protein